MVTHMAILQKLYNAVKSCKDGNVDEGILKRVASSTRQLPTIAKG